MISRSTLPAILLVLALPASAASDSTGLANRLTWGQTANGDALDGMSPKVWLE
jgi:hypothetical protein